MSSSSDNRAVLEVMRLLGIDPLRDIDVGWVAHEFMQSSSNLPAGWTQVRHPDGTTHYVNEFLRIDTVENPLVPRYRKLVEYLRYCKQFGVTRDELTVLELVDPIERPSDVKDMAAYMGIDPWTEPHLLWIAKLCLLEALPDGWDEIVNTEGRTAYVHLPTGRVQEQHPLDPYFKALIDRDRRKRAPCASVQWRFYEWPATRYRVDRTPAGEPLATEVLPAAGPWMDFFDAYGRRYWFHAVTGETTMDANDFRRDLAAVVIQRMWRGHRVRRGMVKLKKGVDKMAGLYLNYKFKKKVLSLEEKRAKAIETIKFHWFNHKVKLEASKELYVRLGLLGLRRPLRSLARTRVAGLLNSERSYHGIRCSVLLIQRAYRAHRARSRGQPAPSVVEAVQISKREFRWPTPFRSWEDPKRGAALMLTGGQLSLSM